MNNVSNIPEFGIKRDNEERRDGGCAFVFDPQSQKYAVGKQENGWLRLFSGGVDENEDIKDGILREVVEESGLHNFEYVEQIAEAMAHYRNSLKNINRVAKATCLLVILKDDHLVPVKLEEHEKFQLTWVSAQDMLDEWNSRVEKGNNDHWIYFLKKAVTRAQELGYDKTTSQDIFE